MFEALRARRQEGAEARYVAGFEYLLQNGHRRAAARAGALIVPSAEWINPYANLTDEQKERMVQEFDPPFPEQPIKAA